MSEKEIPPPQAPEQPGAANGGAAKKKSRPNKYLPTERISFGKAVELLRAYAVAFESRLGPVTPQDAGPLVKLTGSTSALLSAFFVESGFLERAGAEGFVPADEVVTYAREYAWDPEAAVRKLQPIISRTWFAQALMPNLRLGAREEKEALTILGSACNAGPEYRSQLRMLLEYMVLVGLVERDGTQIRAARTTQETTAVQTTATAPPAHVTGRAESAYGQDSQVMRLNLNIDINMAEVSTWAPERITAFFAGIAQVIAAKSGLEKGGGGK